MGQGETVPNFANLLTVLLQRGMRPVIDKTSLAGRFDFVFSTPDPADLAPGGGSPPPIDSNGIPVFTAIQEQLGLKLESTRPYDIVVIDHAEMPTLD